MRQVLCFGFALLPSLCAAQSNAARQAAATITEADIKSRIFIIAHDSMGGRNTPSPGLEKTAAYIAAEFKRFGLKPGGDKGSFIQRYPIRRAVLDTGSSDLTIQGPDSRVRLGFGKDAAMLFGTVRSGTWPVVLVGGPVDTVNPAAGAFKGKAVVWYPDLTSGLGRIRQSLRHLARGGAAAVLVSAAADSLLNGPLKAQTAPRLTVGAGGGAPWILARESAVLAQVPQAAEHIGMMRQSPAFTAQAVEGFTLTLNIKEKALSEDAAPNTVGIIEGSDPTLKNEYIVFSAHMDHVGVTTGGTAPAGAAPADTIFNGADDDASGTVGIVELAEAFSQPGARPKRSLIFLTVSGEEKSLWGSDFFAANPPVPIGQIVANLNADMIGRNWKDTIVVIGKEHSDLGKTLNRVNARHPELRMTAIDDLWPEQSFYTRSDHYNFAKRGVPVLFFFNGTHADYHRPSDSPDKIDTEKESRIVRLMYWLALEIGNAAERPKWDPASYAKFVTEKP